MKYNDNGEIKNIVVKAADSLPVGTIVEYDGDSIPAGYEAVEDKGDFSNEVNFNETPGNFINFEKNGNLIIINYQGENKTHSVSETLFTIPSMYVPKKTILQSFVGYGNCYGQVALLTTGVCQINQISSSDVSSRLVFEFVYTLD